MRSNGVGSRRSVVTLEASKQRVNACILPVIAIRTKRIGKHDGRIRAMVPLSTSRSDGQVRDSRAAGYLPSGVSHGNNRVRNDRNDLYNNVLICTSSLLSTEELKIYVMPFHKVLMLFCGEPSAEARPITVQPFPNALRTGCQRISNAI